MTNTTLNTTLNKRDNNEINDIYGINSNNEENNVPVSSNDYST